MYCSKCGSIVPNEARFCPTCGSPLHAGPEGEAQRSSTDASPIQGDVDTSYSYDTSGSNGASGSSAASAASDEFSGYGYGAPASASHGPYNAPPAGSGAVRTDRDLLAYVLLSLVTCGLYGYWYIYQLAIDVNAMCANDGDETPGLAAYLLLSLVTCGLYSFYWEYRLGNRLQANAPRYGFSMEQGGSDILLWHLLGALICFVGTFIGTHILIKNTNELARAYNAHNGYYA